MNLLKINLLLCLFVGSLLIISCGDETPPVDPGSDAPISSFQFNVSDTDWRVVSFDNFSTNATEYLWDFGDNNTSTEENPTHTYSAGGNYTVSLTAGNGSESKTSEKTVTITDPNQAIRILAGDVSKTWKLFREGVCMSVGPDADNATQWWTGLENDGTRPCMYQQEFTFYSDGRYVFDDMGGFWAEFGLFNNVDGCTQNVTEQACIDATAANMVNACGADISAFLSNTHAFDYDPSSARLTLNGNGAWIGIPKLATDGQTLTPVSSVSMQVNFVEETGYDLMHLEFIYNGEYWPITYVSYSDPSLEPPLKTESEEFGEDLPDISPTELSRTFASADAADFVLLDTIISGAGITYGVDNPDGSGDRVGQYDRLAIEFQEVRFQTAPEKNDINFENLTAITVDIYLPSSNDYSTTLTKNLVVGFGDVSRTEEWWNGLIQYEAIADDLGLSEDTWHTVTFDLANPTFSSNTDERPYDRNDLDMFYIGFGGSGHFAPGTFYLRNLVIN